MQLRILFLFAIIIFLGNFSNASAQVNSILGQVSNSGTESFAGGVSGDGRFVVFESTGNIATVNPRNSDNNREIFLFDYAQRRIFQITDTKSLRTDTAGTYIFSNIKVEITNSRPVISNDGRWIAFGSNAAPPAEPVAGNLNPGSFNAEAYNVSSGTPPTTTNFLTADGNLELWLFEIPPVAPADLTTGEEIPLTDLSAGNFTRVTNTPASSTPRAGSTTLFPFVANDNRDASINDDGSVIAFVSNRNLVTGGNEAPEDNDEIFTYVRASAAVNQVTSTPFGSFAQPIYSVNPVISGNGSRVAFASTGDNPIARVSGGTVTRMTGGSNTDRNDEVFYTDLDAEGAPVLATAKQLTVTTRTNPGDLVNIWSYGKRMSLDGRYIAFDSFADLANEHSGANQTSFALYLYDLNPPVTDPPTTAPVIRRIAPRSNADSGATGGDVARYPGFTDYNSSETPQTLVLETRLNIKADGTIPTNQDEGLNPLSTRPVQIYSYPLNVPAATARFTRLTKLPAPITTSIPSVQPLTSDSVKRIVFNLGLTETGTGNPDFLTEFFYLLQKDETEEVSARFTFATGASRIPVSASPVPTPTATPTPSPSPSPTPDPPTPAAVQGVAPGMLAILNYDSVRPIPIVARTAVGSLQRSFTLPIELSGVTMTINGVAAGLKSVGQREITFVVPPGLSAANGGTVYPVVINNNGTVMKGSITVVPARPDIFTDVARTDLPLPFPEPRARIYNATNTVLTREPFTVTTLKYRGGRRVPTVLRLYLTGVNVNLGSAAFSIRIGNTPIPSGSITTGAVLREPGVYSVDFTLPASLAGAGDQPIIVTVGTGNVSYTTRFSDTAPRVRIL